MRGLQGRGLVLLANASGAAVHAVALAFLRKRLQVLADAVHPHAKARREVIDLDPTVLVEKVKNLCATLASEQGTPASLEARMNGNVPPARDTKDDTLQLKAGTKLEQAEETGKT
jgi:hypothetical protein